MKPSTSREHGSIPMVLLASIIFAGVIVALFSVVESGVRSSAVDRDANQSIQVADAGVQEASVLLQGVGPDDVPDCEPPVGHANTPVEGRCVGVIGQDTAFEWRYTQTAPFAYEVMAVGAYRSHETAVSVEIVRPLRFRMAITVRDQFTYNGAGGGISPPIAVGTFGNATVNGGPAINSIQSITPYYPPGTAPPALTSYAITPSSLIASEVSEGPDLDEDLARDACFDENGVARPNDPANGFFVSNNVPTTLVRGNVYCVRSAEFTNNNYPVVEAPNPAVDYPNPDNPPPAYVFVVGNADGSPAQGVSVSSGGGGPTNGVNWGTEPTAGKLLIAVAQGAGNLKIAGNGRIAAGVWAPWSTCTWSGNPDYRGAVVCQAVTLNGNFGYDDSVNNMDIGEVITQFWSQERVPAWGSEVTP